MTTNTYGLAWTVPLAGFANPRYFAADPTDATGFEISAFDGYVLAFEGTGVSTVVHEQTLDRSGLTGWFPVNGKVVDQAAAALAGNGSLSGKAYKFPQVGVRARVRVTALTTGDAVARVALLRTLADLPATNASVAASSVTGNTAEDAAKSGNPVTTGVEARTSNKQMSASGDIVIPIATLNGVQIVREGSIPELEWSFAPTAPVTTSVATTIKAAAGAGLRNYLTSLQLNNTGAAATEVTVRDGAVGTVIWRGKLPATTGFRDINFTSPLKSTANTLLEILVVTAGAEVYFNAQGYVAP